MENILPFHAASLHPPAMPDPEATTSRRRADWVLLDSVAYIADRPNGTTAQGFTDAGQAVQVSFWLADPPALSHLCVHCPGLKESDFAEVPTIVCSEKDIAIFKIHFSDGPNINVVHRGKHLYFVYKAHHEDPLLDPLRVPSPLCFGNDVFGLLPSIYGEGAFHIAVLRQRLPAKGEYDLHTFSSKTSTWSTRLAQLAPGANGEFLCHKAHKVIIVDGNTLGFVDLWDGIICCRVDDESPVLTLHHIWLPLPMHINRGMFNCASGIRDVICINGVIKFVEIANRTRPVLCEQSNDLSQNSIQHDSDLAKLANNVGDTKDAYAYDGWVAITWNRRAGSDHWIRDCEVDVNDVTVSDQRHLALPPHLSSGHSGKLAGLSKNLIVSAPTFDLQDGDIVYLMCRLETMDETACVLAINTREKTVEDLSFPTERNLYFHRTYCPYALSKHMNMAPRNRKVPCRFKERDYAKTVPNDTTILVHGFDNFVNEAQLMNVFKLFGELSGLNILTNQQASVQYVDRSCAVKAMNIMNGYKLGGKKVAISWGSNTRDKQPLQAHANQCNGDADGYSQSHGYYHMQLKPTMPSNSSSSSVHQNVCGNKRMKLNVGT
ncbi:unnamed protein product [Urochloa decumbens]|uniref:RRM domain-containing protein n=1 Tax=Urochloa decumbens TaxID=240449 RepID=A0ABC9GW85_9POAL